MGVFKSPVRLTLNIYRIVPWVLIDYKVIIGTGNGLAPNRQNAVAEPIATKEFPCNCLRGFSVKECKDIYTVHKKARIMLIITAIQ